MNKSIKVEELQGAYTALITTMDEKGQIDYAKLDRLIEDQISAGVDGLLACGTTGQSAHLKPDEQAILAEYVFNKINGRVHFMVGAGSNNTEEGIDLSKRIEDRIGPSTLLHVTGYYNNPTQKGLIDYFTKVTDAIDKDSNIILYSVKGRTNSNIDASTAVELAQNPKIIGIKEASGDIKQVYEIIRNTNDSKFRVLSGDDDTVSLIIELGGYGVISASMNVAPKPFVELTKKALAIDFKGAYDIQKRLSSLVKAVFAQGTKNPEVLASMFNSGLRSPMIRPEKQDYWDKIQKQINSALSTFTPEELGINLADYK